MKIVKLIAKYNDTALESNKIINDWHVNNDVANDRNINQLIYWYEIIRNTLYSVYRKWWCLMDNSKEYEDVSKKDFKVRYS